MALPTATEVATLDYAMYGEPCVVVPAKSTIDTELMDIAMYGEPIVGNDGGGGGDPVTCPIMISGWGWSMGGF